MGSHDWEFRIAERGLKKIRNTIVNGEMAERFKAAVLKTVERKLRGFESLSLRHKKSTEFQAQSITWIKRNGLIPL